MTEKEKLLDNLVSKSGKSKEELEKLVKNKVDELSGLVSEEGAIYIIANDFGIRLDVDRPKRTVEFKKIIEITEPKEPISFKCKVIRKYDKVTFSSASGGEGNVQSMLVGDDSAVIRLVFWNDKTALLENIHEGDVLSITNAYTRENNNSERIEIHYGQYSDIEVNPQGVKIDVVEYKPEIEFTEKKISDLEENDRNVKISGIITDFDIPRFYLGCPQTYKKVFQDEGKYISPTHGEVEPIRIPIVNIVIDDGSGSIPVVAFRDRAEGITQAVADEIITLSEDIEKYRAFSKKMVGAKTEIIGNVSTNSMTGDAQFLANIIDKLELKTVDEVIEELILEEKSEEEKKKEKKVEEDELDIDIEEIDIDDDLL